MAPKPEQRDVAVNGQLPPELDGESVVISGMAGIYPQSRSVKDLSNILYNKINPVTADKSRWDYSHPELPPYIGKAPGIERFDAQFFKVHHRQALVMDVTSKKVLEQTYQAIFDAGLSSEQLSGKKVGVYIAHCFSETEKNSFYDPSARTGFGISGCSKTMNANRISYWLNVVGPSMAIDGACCGSLAALEQAVQDIKSGECESAIVGGTHLCLHPQPAILYGRVFPLNQDGKTKCFSQNCDGVTRSEAVNVLFLQKAKHALRIYGHVLHVKNGFVTDSMESEYGFVRNPRILSDFINEFYEEANVSPAAIEYVEAFGPATPEADKAELDVIERVYCKDRKKPLLVGSIASNIGYTETASGISAITKVLLGYQKGELAANLHCSDIRKDIPALQDGRMRIVSEHQPFGRSYAAVNSLAYTGINGHVLLHGHYKPKDMNRYKSNIPYLVTISGRHEDAVKKIQNDLKSRPIDPEELALLHNIYEHNQPGHMGRGYIILDTKENKTVSVAEKCDYFDDAKRPIWFVYSGMGSQWTGMGTHLMRIPVFATAIQRCDAALKPKGIDIVKILTSDDKTMFDNILHSFVGIAAVQIGLTDVLREMGIVPDKIIGHSVGELGCGYADGCFTVEEMILAAYSRGLVSLETPFIRGSMAAVGLGYQEVVKLCPPEIEVACHNGPESATISGPAEAMKEFVAKLTAQGIFAKEVPCSNIAYHSRYIAEAGPKLLEYLNKVIKNPKKRTDRWLSTSIPEERWGEEQAQYCSPWYHTNNLLNQVLFEETSRHVPPNAVLIEVAPHGLLQAILKRSLSPDCRHIPLTKRGHPDNSLFVLEAIGKIFMEGYNPKVNALYPKVDFPVSTGTPMLSHLVEWSHGEHWKLPIFKSSLRKRAAVRNMALSIHDDEYAYLQGNVVRGKMQYPFAASLVAVWETLAMMRGDKMSELSVQFRDVHLYSQPILHDKKHLQFNVTIQWGTGRFEVMHNLSKVASGYITSEISHDKIVKGDKDNNDYLDFDSKEIYENLTEKNYSYSGEFCSLHRANSSFTKAQVLWNENWVTFLDGLLQLNVLRRSHNTVSQPSHISKIVIDVANHTKDKFELSDEKLVLSVDSSPIYGITSCGGVDIEKIEFYDLPPLVADTLLLKNCKFIPYFRTDCTDLIEIFKTYLQIVVENSTKDVIKVVEIASVNENTKIDILTMLKDIPGSTVLYEQLDRNSLFENEQPLDVDAVLVTNLSLDKKTYEILQRSLQPGTFVINGEQIGEKSNLSSDWYRVVSSANVGRSLLELGRWKVPKKQPFQFSVIVRTESDLKKLNLEREKLPPNGKLLVLTPYPIVDGLKNLIKQWRKESSRNQIYLASVSGNDNLERLPVSSLDFDLAFNVYYKGIWGGEYFVEWQENIAVERGMTLLSERIGDLNSLRWVEAPEHTGSGIMVTVRYAGINDFDVKRATAVIPFTDEDPEKHQYGMDYSGTTERGDRVMGIVRNGAASGRVRAVPELLWPVPEHWTLEDAATVPLAYAQAFYCLGIKAALYPRMAVLIHGGAGALGQAAIAIALANDCEVFTTVGTTRKKHFLKKLFPQLKEENIGNSRDNTFGDMVLQLTKGKGCDIIISCVKGGLKNTTLKCASFCGITFDTVQAYSEDSYSYGMFYMTKQRSYVILDFDTVFDYEEDMKALQEMMSEGIARGYVRPLSRVTFSAQEAARAFRLLATSRHRGRALLRLRDTIIPVLPRLTCTLKTSHLVLCDATGLGLQLAARLVKRGAENLRLHFTSALPANLQLKVGSWEKQGVNVEVSVENLDSSNVANIVNETLRMAPLEGIYMVVNGSENVKSIINGLDLASRKLCPNLRYFALLATNNDLGPRVCLNRVSNSLPATFLFMPALKQETLSWHNMLDAIERGLHSKQPIILIQSLRNNNTSLFQQVAAVADITVDNGVDENKKLQDLGFDSSRAQIVSTFLHNTYNVYLGVEELPELTVKQINDLEVQLSEPDFKDVKGLKTFFSYIDSDENLTTTPLLFLPTLVKKIKMRDEEVDAEQTYLCIVPGLEGHYERFRGLCARLHVPAAVLQPGDTVGETLHDTAKRYAETLRKKIQIKDNFYILGYESGIKTALELVSNLEEDGLTGTVYCLGGAPEEIESIIEDKLKEFKGEGALQNALIRHMADLMTNGLSDKLNSVLKTSAPWQEKLKTCVETLKGLTSQSKKYTQSVIETAYARIHQLREYRVQARALRSRLIVLRVASNLPTISDKELQRYSKQPVETYYLQAPLAHVAQDPRCAAIINRHLSKDLKEAFENLNKCDTYVLNDGFITKPTTLDENDQ